MKGKEESEKAGLKLKIKKLRSWPVPWQIDGAKVETMIDFISLGSKITVDSDYSLEIKKCLLLGRNIMINQARQHIKKQDIILLT